MYHSTFVRKSWICDPPVDLTQRINQHRFKKLRLGDTFVTSVDRIKRRSTGASKEALRDSGGADNNIVVRLRNAAYERLLIDRENRREKRADEKGSH
ncbi:hypothetical protein VTN00DRAFT_758 [Thermoascus crustaceus]|uniref:uncharacterized protein n=1 Tax=Thermoascus crustaceus TaxID=5088 RepID=UPI003741F61F